MNISNLFIRHQNTFKALIVVKIFVLVFLGLYYSKALYFDEKVLTAEEEVGSEKQQEVDSEELEPNSTEDSNTEDSSSSAETENSESEGNTDSSAQDSGVKEKRQTVRRNFLAGLLELPTLNKDNIRKDELGKYLNLAEQKLQQVEVRLSVLREQENNLLEIEKKVEDKIKNLEEDHRYYSETIQKEKDLKSERLEKLVSLYKKMEPKKAAQVFETMDRDLVVAMFRDLPEKQTMKILELMSPEKSTQLSEYFGRVRSGKEYELLKEINTSLVKEFAVCKGYKGE